MHSPPRKITSDEQKEWFIPPCISNWKNARGYTIPLDKRLAADGRGLQEVTINDNFAKFAEALYIADRHAREEVEKRAQMQKKLAQKEKESKEMHLRMLAQKAREERYYLLVTLKLGAAHLGRSGFGVAPVVVASSEDDREDYRSPSPRTSGRRRSPAARHHDRSPEDEGYRERERLREETRKDIQRKIRMSHMGADTKAKMMARDQERDVSEKIALGQLAPNATKESMYDQRLFNQTSGLGTGFKDEEGTSNGRGPCCSFSFHPPPISPPRPPCHQHTTSMISHCSRRRPRPPSTDHATWTRSRTMRAPTPKWRSS